MRSYPPSIIIDWKIEQSATTYTLHQSYSLELWISYNNHNKDRKKHYMIDNCWTAVSDTEHFIDKTRVALRIIWIDYTEFFKFLLYIQSHSDCHNSNVTNKYKILRTVITEGHVAIIQFTTPISVGLQWTRSDIKNWVEMNWKDDIRRL